MGRSKLAGAKIDNLMRTPRKVFGASSIPLHRSVFEDKEKEYLM